jgi:N-methylhydantoinase B
MTTSRQNGRAAIDPITFEVIRHKLEAITEEQAITLKNVSGSPVVTEATDFNVGIYLADGAIVNMGPQVIFHAGTMSTVIYSIIEHFSDNPGINEGGTEIDTSEKLLRERLKLIPDGIYRARDFLDHDGHANRLYQIEVAAIKRGDTLTLDMSESSPQAPGFINCTRSGLRGALFTGLLPILAPDIRWNEGVLKPVTITVPEANICNARWPTPVSGATVSTAWVAQNVAVAAISRMVAAVPELVREGQAVTKGQFSVLTMAGADRDGGPFGMLLMDAMAGGGGAYIDHDGLDGSGDHSIPRPRIGNVEGNEASGPFLYLFRSFMADTAGAGTMRGGVTMGLAVTPHDTDELHTMIVGHGVQVPNAVGQFGGIPGACAYHLMRKSNAGIAELIDANTHMHDLLNAGGSVQRFDSKPGHLPLHRGDVLAYSFQGGGGYGDPIRRDPARVARDIHNGFVTPQWASALYGVVTGDGAVDAEATRARRRAIRTERLGGRTPKAETPEYNGIASVCPMIGEGKRFRFRCLCGADLGPATAGNRAPIGARCRRKPGGRM